MANYNYDIRRTIPAELSNGGYGNFEAAQALSSMAAGSIDQSLLQHENPNRCTENDLAPRLPLEQYRLNVDQNPHVIRRKPNEKVQYLQEIAVRYLKPPPPARAGDIIIKELPAKQVAPAPPLIVRQPGPKAPTPPPVCIRECPPPPPQPLPGKVITVPGKTIPPPARKVIVERLPPIPPKPQQIFVERWLPYGEQRQRVIYEPAKPICQIPDPKNVVIQWDAPDVEVRREVKNLGVQQADPQDYLRRHGHQLVRSDQLPEVAIKYAQAQGIQLAATAGSQQAGVVIEGDVQALSLIDLDAHGLGYLRGRLSQSVNNLSFGGGLQQQQQQSNLYDSYDSGVSHSYANVSQPAAAAVIQAHQSQSQAHYGSHQNLSSAYSSEHVDYNQQQQHLGGGASISASSSHNVADYNAAIPGAFPCDEPAQQQHHHQQQSNVEFPC